MSDGSPPIRNFFDQVAAWLMPGDENGGARRRLAQIFALLGALFALLDLLLSTLDLADRALGRLRPLTPYIVPAALAIGALASIYLIRSGGPAQRRRAVAGLALIVAAAAGWGGWTVYQTVSPPRAATILVADFDGERARIGVNWGRRIFEQVEAQVDRLQLGDSVDVQRVYEPFADADEARQAGDARKATLVLWGWYDDLGVSPHFELLRQAARFKELLVAAPPNTGSGPQAMPAASPQDLTDFSAYVGSGPQEMAYLTTVVLGLVRYAESDYTGAESLFSAALGAAPQQSALVGLHVPHLFRANARMNRGDLSQQDLAAVIADLEAALVQQPDLWQANWNLALAYADYCNPALALDDALVQAERVRELRSGDATAYWLVGQTHGRRGDWEAARSAFEQAVALDPSYADGYQALGGALWNLDLADASQAAYDRALALRTQPEAAPGSDDPANAADVRGYTFINAGRYDEAIAAFREALALEPENADFLRHLGNAYYWKGQDAGGDADLMAQAIGEYEKAQALDPDDALLLTTLGGAYAQVGRAEDALAAYQQAVATAPCDDGALILLASQLETMGRSAEAEEAFRKLTVLNPRQAIGWHVLATAAYLREDFSAAAENYRRGLEVAPEDANLNYGLASSLYALGDYTGAETAYRRTRELLPEDAASWAGWGDSLAKLGRLAPAIEAYEKVTELDPDESLYWVSLGMLYEGVDRVEDALGAYNRAAALAPEDPLLHASRGAVLQTLGRYNDAADAYRAATSLTPDQASYWESLALNLSAANRQDEALRAADETLARNPASFVAYMVRGGALELQGRAEDARSAYERAVEFAPDGSGARRLADEALKRLSGGSD
jgi:tetratricopeptide (TPR) repeat protein